MMARPSAKTEPVQVPPACYRLAESRTRPLLDRLAAMEGDLKALLASAYLQGVNDLVALLERRGHTLEQLLEARP